MLARVDDCNDDETLYILNMVYVSVEKDNDIPGIPTVEDNWLVTPLNKSEIDFKVKSTLEPDDAALVNP